MQLNAALPTTHALRCGAAVSRRLLSRSVGLASFGARRAQSVLSRSTSTVGVGRPSFGGQRKVSSRSRSVALGASGASAIALSGKVAWAACPAAVSARLSSAQAPRSEARCPNTAAFVVKLGHSQAQRVLAAPASCNGGCLGSFAASKLTVVNASHFIGCGSANAAPNPSVKRTA